MGEWGCAAACAMALSPASRRAWPGRTWLQRGAAHADAARHYSLTRFQRWIKREANARHLAGQKRANAVASGGWCCEECNRPHTALLSTHLWQHASAVAIHPVNVAQQRQLSTAQHSTVQHSAVQRSAVEHSVAAAKRSTARHSSSTCGKRPSSFGHWLTPFSSAASSWAPALG